MLMELMKRCMFFVSGVFMMGRVLLWLVFCIIIIINRTNSSSYGSYLAVFIDGFE